MHIIIMVSESFISFAYPYVAESLHKQEIRWLYEAFYNQIGMLIEDYEQIYSSWFFFHGSSLYESKLVKILLTV
ncbi:hypothetical protein [Bacillus sp. FJAT-49736]|uniref:hypothetical protein n=1 Tax=Bacillus sp. FJAT-49736 TaxID=2833582 RepID=UPI001BC970EF|nr:hypothetical protein [Bacillus sp. FJAT-49736]MBS4172868.1 hypothetical protein [Bacillus sp. FJAT-49736]